MRGNHVAGIAIRLGRRQTNQHRLEAFFADGIERGRKVQSAHGWNSRHESNASVGYAFGCASGWNDA